MLLYELGKWTKMSKVIANMYGILIITLLPCVSYWIGSMFNVYSSMVETDDLLYNIYLKNQADLAG